MLSLNPFSELRRTNFDDFFSMPIATDFSKPEYYIGQYVLHKVKVPTGEILYPVRIIGVFWTGENWEYSIELPCYHRFYVYEDKEIDWTEEYFLESM